MIFTRARQVEARPEAPAVLAACSQLQAKSNPGSFDCSEAPCM
jgi:hypothetical protein